MMNLFLMATPCRSFINVKFSAEGHRRAKFLELNFVVRKLSSRWSDQAGKFILTTSEFAQYLVLHENPLTPYSHMMF